MESLFDKLKSLGMQLGASQPLQIKSVERISIEKVVSGNFFTTAYGAVFVVENDYDICQTLGLPSAENLPILSEWAGSPALLQCQVGDIIFLDTETSGLSGGSGTFAFMIGLGYFVQGGFHLVQLFMRDPSEEPALLSGLHHFLGQFRSVVTYNGKSFDIPLLNSRHVINGFSTPFTPDIAHVDLLHLARRLWRNRLPSRTLKDLEIELLDIRRSQEEVPGWMVPELYFNYLRSGDAGPLAGVFYHNSLDIVSLACLFNFTASLLSHPLEFSHVDSLDLIAIARLYDQLGRVEEAITIYEKSLEQGLPQRFYLDTILRYSQIHKKRGDWDIALRLWKKGADINSAEACIELAKYYEHHDKDYDQALNWCQNALEYLVIESDQPGLRDDTITRINRIQHKRQRSSLSKRSA